MSSLFALQAPFDPTAGSDTGMLLILGVLCFVIAGGIAGWIVLWRKAKAYYFDRPL